MESGGVLGEPGPGQPREVGSCRLEAEAGSMVISVGGWHARPVWTSLQSIPEEESLCGPQIPLFVK